MTEQAIIRNSLEPAARKAAPRRRRASRARTWTITLLIAGSLLATMYSVATHRAEVQDEHRQTEMQKDAAPPAPGLTRPAI